MRGVKVAAVVASAAAAIACGAQLKLDARNLFADLTYDDSDASSPAKVVPFQLYATLEEEALLPWVKPSAVADCLTTFDIQAMARAAKANEFATDSWGRAVWREATDEHNACFANVADDDKVLAAYVLAQVALDVWSTVRDATATDAGAASVYDAAKPALERVAAILRQQHPNTKAQTSDETMRQSPALALSGGAANGAFSAGFLAELLSVRLRVLASMDKKIDSDEARNTRFGALVGTSVGAVLAQILDLYYVDDASLYAANKKFFDECNAFWDLGVGDPTPQAKGSCSECFNGWTPQDGNVPSTINKDVRNRFPVQACAIRYLYKLTEVEEQDLICAPRGPITNAVGLLGPAHPGLVRFDPMGTNIVDPFVGRFTGAMENNDVIRSVVSIETVNNQTLGLDERSCWGLGSLARSSAPLAPNTSENCLASGVMASLVLPFFAIPVRHAYSGWTEGGECGSWLDGGLRSGFPALRALNMTRPNVLDPPKDKAPRRLRVLAINNGQLDGSPHKRSQGIHEVALNAIGQMSGQVDVYEIALAQQVSALRERAVQSLMTAKRGYQPGASVDAGADAGPVAQAFAIPTAPNDDDVSPVWVPNEVAPSVTSGAEYSFDKYIMRGLFTWGRRLAIQRLLEQRPGKPDEKRTRELARWLGWVPIANAMYDEAKNNDATDPKWNAWQSAYEHEECFPFHVTRSHAGTSRIVDKMPRCANLDDPDAGANAPDGSVEPYFFCKPPAAEVR